MRYLKRKNFIYTLPAFLERNCKEPEINILINTGTSRSYISENFMHEKLGLSPSQSVQQVNIDMEKEWQLKIKNVGSFQSRDFDISLGWSTLKEYKCLLDYMRGFLVVNTSKYHAFRLKK